MANSIDILVNTNGVTVLNQTAEAADNAAKSFGIAKTELNNLQKQLQDMAAAGQQNTEEFRKAAERAGELKSSLQGLTAEINANAGSAFEGISNNVSLFGDRLMSLDLKGAGQALTGMGNAVSRINIKSLKDELGGLVSGLGNLAGAIISNPLLALGGAVVGLIMNFDKINNILAGTAEKVEKLGQANLDLETQNKLLENKLNIEKISNANSAYAIKLQKEIAQNNIKAAENELTIAKTTGDINSIREKENLLIEKRNFLNTITAQQEKDRQGAVDYARSILYKGYKEQLENSKQQQLIETQRVATAELIKQKQEELLGVRAKESILIQDSNKEDEKKKKNFVEINNEAKVNYIERAAESEAVKAKQDEINKLIAEESDLKKVSNMLWNGELLKVEEVNTEIAKGDDAAAKRLKDRLEYEKEARQSRLDDIERIDEEIYQTTLSEQEKEIDAVRNKYFELITLADFYGRDSTSLKETQAKAEAEINKKYADAALQLKLDNDEKLKAADEKAKAEAKKREEEATQFEIQSQNQLAEAKWNIANGSISLLGTLFQKNKKAADVAFALEKGLAIAKVVISNRAANADIFAKQLAFYSSSGPLAIPLAAASSAPMFAANNINAAAAIAAIVASGVSKFMNGGGVGGGGGGTMPSGGGGTQAPSPANFAFLGNQPNQQPPLQAYVVSSQVSSNLEAQQLIQNQSKLGG